MSGGRTETGDALLNALSALRKIAGDAEYEADRLASFINDNRSLLRESPRLPSVRMGTVEPRPPLWIDDEPEASA